MSTLSLDDSRCVSITETVGCLDGVGSISVVCLGAVWLVCESLLYLTVIILLHVAVQVDSKDMTGI